MSVNEDNTVSPAAAETTVPTSPTPAAGSAPINHRRTREFSRQPLIAPSAPPQTPPQTSGANLDADDLQITLTAEVHGRALPIANCRCEAIVYDGVRTHSRGIFFQTLERLIEEVKQALAVKVNRALPQDPAPPDPKHNGNGGKPHLVTEKIPPYTGSADEDMPDLRIHIPPGLDYGRPAE